MRTPGSILLVACYELGHQPITLASPLAVLRRGGFAPTAIDTSVDALPDSAIDRAQLVAISVPMHTALRLGTRVAEGVRARNPQAHICFYGLYAWLNAEYLLRAHADSIIGGEYEEALLALAKALEAGAPGRVPGVRTAIHDAAPVLARLPFATPSREDLAPLSSYAYLVRGTTAVRTGYVEASRGCLHTCAHCPITPIYSGRFFVVPRQVVLDDIRAQVEAGARHITFGDPDFLNGPRHSLEIVRAMHAEFPDVTFDATIKVEHILERQTMMRELAELGCAFIVTAVESVSDDVLLHLRKQHTRADIADALDALCDAGIPMRPTWVAFTPWTTADDYRAMLAFIADHDLVENVDPVQYTIRLLVPPGSALLDAEDTAGWLGPLDQEAFSYRWEHPDQRMDELHRRMAALVERTLGARHSSTEIFRQVCDLTAEVLGAPVEARIRELAPVGAGRKPIPHLSEPWFC